MPREIDIRTITRDDAEYPESLREIAQPPEQLFVRGVIPAGVCFAVVGTRLPTTYGKQVTPKLVYDLARAGLIIVSGLAYGVDTLAHEAALDAGGLTIAVLGTGVDEGSLYPRKHLKLARRIVDTGGAVISEYPSGTEGKKYHFPARNRVVSGMSVGTLVIEAKEKSGALITARHALDQNRDIYAVPGPVTSPQSVGPNRLIRDGATPVLSPMDIIENYGASPAPQRKLADADATEEERRVLDALVSGALHVDMLASATGMAAQELLPLLTQLELKALIHNVGAGQYSRT